jgi:hypothetical protein
MTGDLLPQRRKASVFSQVVAVVIVVAVAVAVWVFG